MRCPHCREHISPAWEFVQCGSDPDGLWGIRRYVCPNENCRRLVISLIEFNKPQSGQPPTTAKSERFARPHQSAREPAPSDVPTDIAQDFKEACNVYSESPKASAALSRRCLQSILRSKAGIQPGDLNNEIQQVLDSHTLPSHLSESIDGIRAIGNFAAHPTKALSSGTIVDVEPGEADWNLDVLELLFDFYFVQPSLRQKKRDAINKKLQEAGKPPIK